MPMHDWTRVAAGIFHAFHHDWITEMARALNNGLLPDDYYALPEQQAAGFGPDVLALQSPSAKEGEAASSDTATLIRTRPKSQFHAETDAEFYRRKKSSIVVRHISGDRIVAMLEVVSPGNKASRHALRTFVDKACELLEHRIHLLIADPFPPSSQRNSRGHLGGGARRTVCAAREQTVDAGGLRVRSDNASPHSNACRWRVASQHAFVPGSQWPCPGAVRVYLSDCLRRHAPTMAYRSGVACAAGISG
jgi:hypothetical protein